MRKLENKEDLFDILSIHNVFDFNLEAYSELIYYIL